jgi:5-hydroxyisourate hydrolase-like protein (transthyretin family)
MGTRTVGMLSAFAVGVTLLAAPQAVGGEALASVVSRATSAPTTLTLRVDNKRLQPGDRVTFRARLLDESTGSPVPNEDVMLQWQRSGSSGWQEGTTKATGQGGRVEWPNFFSNYSSRYRVVYLGSTSWDASVSPTRLVVVKPAVEAVLRRDWVRPDGVVKLRGRVNPAYSGERVSLQRRVDGQWRTVTSVQQGGQGRFTFRIGGMDAYGPQTYRVALEARDAHLGAISGPMQLTTVRLVTYRIETRGSVRGALDTFKERTAEIYADPRGWSRSYVHFKRVTSGGAFSLVLSQAKYVPSFGSICDRYWSCRVGRYVIINENRWRHGTPYFKRAGGTMAEYRAMVTNHETGHWFGLGHATCGGKGQAAPVMMQQSKGLYGCEPNAWPLAGEIARAR